MNAASRPRFFLNVREHQAAPAAYDDYTAGGNTYAVYPAAEEDTWNGANKEKDSSIDARWAARAMMSGSTATGSQAFGAYGSVDYDDAKAGEDDGEAAEYYYDEGAYDETADNSNWIYGEDGSAYPEEAAGAWESPAEQEGWDYQAAPEVEESLEESPGDTSWYYSNAEAADEHWDYADEAAGVSEDLKPQEAYDPDYEQMYYADEEAYEEEPAENPELSYDQPSKEGEYGERYQEEYAEDEEPEAEEIAYEDPASVEKQMVEFHTMDSQPFSTASRFSLADREVYSPYAASQFQEYAAAADVKHVDTVTEEISPEDTGEVPEDELEDHPSAEEILAEEEPQEEEEEEEEAPQEAEEEEVVAETDTSEANELQPYTLDQINSRVEVRHVPGKGRCVFVRQDVEPGDVIFVELPTLVATPKLDRKLWETLQQLHAEEPFDLPPVWHLAALYSLTRLSASDRAVINDKWVPNPNKEPSADVIRVLRHTNLAIDPKKYEKFLQAWRYNSFGHHVESDGLVLYNRISMIAHSCSSTASWHYGSNESFTLRARRHIPKGGEVTISYIGDEELLKPTDIRREKLQGWLFHCLCEKCTAPIDSSRGLRCSACGAGTVFFKGHKDVETGDTVTTSSACTFCKVSPSPAVIEDYLNLEAAYIARLDETNKSDLVDAEHVFSEAQRVFSQHWVLFQLDTVLFEGYKDSSRWMDAAAHQSNRIKFVSHVVTDLSYTLAWLLEELGDLYCHAAGLRITGDTSDEDVKLTAFQRNLITEKYETAMNMLILLCGTAHDYTRATHKKLGIVFSASKGVFNTSGNDD